MGHPGRVSFSVESFRSSTKPNEEIPARHEPCEIASTLLEGLWSATLVVRRFVESVLRGIFGRFREFRRTVLSL